MDFMRGEKDAAAPLLSSSRSKIAWTCCWQIQNSEDSSRKTSFLWTLVWLIRIQSLASESRNLVSCLICFPVYQTPLFLRVRSHSILAPVRSKFIYYSWLLAASEQRSNRRFPFFSLMSKTDATEPDLCIHLTLSCKWSLFFGQHLKQVSRTVNKIGNSHVTHAIN